MPSRILKAYRSMRYGAPIVVVSGLPRSGTSMAMQMLEAGGLALVQDGVRSANEDNPRGYYELERVKDLGRDEDKRWLREARGKGIKIISYLLKDLPGTSNYKVLLMSRDVNEVLASQTKMLARSGLAPETEDERMLQIWREHLSMVRFLLRRRPQFDFMELPYASVIRSPRKEAQRICEFLKMKLDVDEMAAAVDGSLYRNRS